MRLLMASLVCFFILFFADQYFTNGQYTDSIFRLAHTIWHSFGF
jgi:hypothetical protein